MWVDILEAVLPHIATALIGLLIGWLKLRSPGDAAKIARLEERASQLPPAPSPNNEGSG
jgi:hypothetical protein